MSVIPDVATDTQTTTGGAGPATAGPRTTPPGSGYDQQAASLRADDVCAVDAGAPSPERAARDLDFLLLPMPVRARGTALSISAASSWLNHVLGVFQRAQGASAAMEQCDQVLWPAVERGANFAANPLTTLSNDIRTNLQTLMNNSGVTQANRTADPTLPTQAEIHAWHDSVRSLRGVLQDPSFPTGTDALLTATSQAEDAALALLQARSVLSARETWRANDEEPSRANAASRTRARTEVDDVFRDSGGAFGDHASADNGTGIWDWCGMFVGAALWRGAGLDEELRSGLYHTSNVHDLFNYAQRANAARSPRSIWADGQWWDLRAYHESRGSVRTWQDDATISAAIEARQAAAIRSGDVALIDHTNNGSPNHIVMVETYDATTQTLVTIEGNTMGIKAADTGGGAERSAVVQNADGTTSGGRLESGDYTRTGTGVHIRDMRTSSRASRTAYATEIAADPARERGEYRPKSGNSVHGVGRPSIVDMEEHSYASRAIPEALKNTSPQEMTARQRQSTGARTEQ